MKKIHQRPHDSTFSALTVLSHLLSSQRSKALCVWLNFFSLSAIHAHPLPTRAALCSLVLCLSFSEPTINTAHTMFRIKGCISNSFWVCCPFLKNFFIYTGSFSHLKNTYTFPVRGGYPLILHEIEKMPLGTARLYLTGLIDLTFTSSHLHSNHSYLVLHTLVSLTFF